MIYRSFFEEMQKAKKNPIQWIVLFLMPVLTVFLLGTELKEEVISNIPMAVIDRDDSSFSRQLVEAFDSNDTFEVTYYPGSSKEMENLLKDSKARIGMIIPENFLEDVTALESPTVMMIYDGANMSTTGVAKAKAMEILLTYKTGVAMKQIGGRLGIDGPTALATARVIKFESRYLYNPAKSFEDFLAPILMAGYMQAAIALTASVSVNHTIFGKGSKSRMGYGLGKVIFYTWAGTLGYLICVSLQRAVFDMPFKGSPFSVLILAVSLSFAVASFSVLISTVIRNPMVALIGAGVVFIPNSVMAGTTLPVSAMPVGFRGFSGYIPFTHFANNLRDVYLKGSGMAQFGNSIAYMMIFGGISLGLVELVLWLAGKEAHDENLSGIVQKGIPADI